MHSDSTRCSVRKIGSKRRMGRVACAHEGGLNLALLLCLYTLCRVRSAKDSHLFFFTNKSKQQGKPPNAATAAATTGSGARAVSSHKHASSSAAAAAGGGGGSSSRE